ncbi:MAG: methyltransferase domain-containing protein [Gammaproteobacteria bacterium]
MNSADRFRDLQIVESWKRNALPWTIAVRERHIESRRLITDKAMIDAIANCSPRLVLDVGCGEGWLVRILTGLNIEAVGVDVVPALIEAATRAGDGDFRVMSYEDIAAGALKLSVDLIACNFSLLGKESVEGLFLAARSLLGSRGSMIVQTLHPIIACGDRPYRDGWRDGSWAGISGDFSDPAPWYFRTLESWSELFTASGFRLREIREPLHPETQKPISVIFIGEPAA